MYLKEATRTETESGSCARRVSLVRRKISSLLLTVVVYRATKCRLAPSTRYRNALLASRETCDVKLTTSESLVPSD